MYIKEKIQPWVKELVQCHGAAYASPNNVELILDPDDETFHLGCRWPAAEIPGTPAVHLEFTREFEDYYAFTNVFPIHFLHDLDFLTPEGLFKLYHMGELYISALVDGLGFFENLLFRIRKGGTCVWDDEANARIQYTGQLLHSPEEIILFTRKYIDSKYPMLSDMAPYQETPGLSP